MNRLAGPRSRLDGAHGDLWTLGALFALSRFHWIVDQHYHQHPYATGAIAATLLLSLLLVMIGYAAVLTIGGYRARAPLRIAVLAILALLALLQLRYVFFPTRHIGAGTEMTLAASGLLFAVGIAWVARGIWPRLRAALLAAAAIAVMSPPALALVLAERVDILPAPASAPRPVVVLLFDELSAGGASGIVEAMQARGLIVAAKRVPSIGENTMDVIPAIFSGKPLPDAIPCSASAVCGSARAVDFARIHVGRPDVDIVGIYHRYCAIRGLRYCTNPEHVAPEQTLTAWFLCAMPARRLYSAWLDCSQPAVLAKSVRKAARFPALLGAPFWTQGGVLYAHLRLPHPPGDGDEPRLEDAYRNNLRLTAELTGQVVDRLRASAFGADFAIVVTSDHPLRVKYWCTEEPYRTQGCAVGDELSTAEVPFLVAGPGTLPAVEPRTNAGLLEAVVRLSAR